MDVQLHAFPSKDREFVEYAKAAWLGLQLPRTPEDLQHVLRIRYPAAIVIVQNELARHGDGPFVWYVFRTAAIGTPPIDDAPEDGAAWAILDGDRRFLEVSPALARIAELSARQMVGRLIEDFSNPADPTIREDIGRLWSEFRNGGSLASTLRFNYVDGRPRELAYRLVADAGGPGRHRLTVHVLPPSEGDSPR